MNGRNGDRNGHGNGRAVGRRHRTRGEGPVLVTGGAGFVGTNLADRLARDGEAVRIFDDLSRPGVETNLEWLLATHGDRIEPVVGDVRDANAVKQAVAGATAVFHFAAQVAVTTSLEDPEADFQVNARGTLNLLEALRGRGTPPPLLFTSTNKVYGSLPDVTLTRVDDRYLPIAPEIRLAGIGEERGLDFHSPYGCSKGAADQYVIDYARTFGLPATVFRMSCIYGPHQCGTEDQGWVAHFLISALEGRPITLYGDGMQVRDVLFVEDLVEAMLAARHRIEATSGHAFNIGGGPLNSVSLLELLELIGDLHGERPEVRHAPWRPGDQRYYVSNTSRFREATGWRPTTPVAEGVERLYQWLAHEVAGAVPATLEVAGLSRPAAAVAIEGGAA